MVISNISLSSYDNFKIMRLNTFFCFLFLFTFFTSLAQSKGAYENGKLFAQIKNEYAASFSVDELLKQKTLAEFKITAISKAFKINEEALNRIYLIEFSNHAQTERLLSALLATKLFEYAEKVPLYESFYTPNDLNSAQWNLKMIKAENAWNIKKGSSKIIIAMVDDAMDTAHQDLEPAVWRNKGEIRGNGMDDDGNGYIDDYIGWDFADNDNDPTPGGALQHGTHCSGIAGAVTNNSKGIASIGFGCQLMIAKIGKVGYSYLFNPYQGVEYAIINKANVISMSWGGGGYSYTYQLIFDNAYKKGIVCVAAAGNSSTSITHYPSGYNHVIAVGSTTSSDKISSFSNYGTWVDVMAPGSAIYSTLPNNNYGNLSGTSMACPLVSGLCGLMFSQNPKATPDEIEACLKSGCENINSLNSSYIGLMGAGRINAENSLKCLKSINADFTSSTVQTCPGDTVQFFDKTIPTPVSLKWKFTGGTPSTSTLNNPKIKYATAGVYDVELIVFDSTSSDTLLMKNYITIALPKAAISVNRTILLGNSTTIRFDFTGNAPYKFTLFDGTTSKVISNISATPYFHVVSPIVTTTYTITAFNDKKCTGTYSGSSKVTILTTTNCLNALRYQASFGGASDDLAYGLSEDSAQNVYISGSTQNYGSGDGFFAKFNGAGNMVWYKSYGGSASDLFQKHIKTPDNGFLLVGSSTSYGNGGGDVWIVKVDSSGTIQWSKTVGGSGYESAWNATVANDNGYFIYGQTNSYGAGDFDNYLIRLDKNGNLKWTKTYGNAYFNDLKGLATFSDGSSMICSNYRTSTDGDALIAKIDSSGNLLWSKRFGSSFNDGLYTLAKGSNDNVYIAGFMRSSSTNQEMFIACFSPSGVNKWMKLITGSGNDALYNIENDGDNFIVNGHTDSYGAGGVDASLIKFDTSGNILFAKTMGGTNDDYVFSCLRSIDEGYYSVGQTKSFTNGGNDIFLNKLSCKPLIGCNEKDYTPSTSNLSLTINNESQSTSSGGSLNSQSISATKRSTSVSYQCLTSPLSSSPEYNCLKVDNFSKISSTTTGFTGVLDDGDYFGQAVRRIGDFDKDGVEDIVVGSQYDDDGGSNQGAIYIIFLKRDGSIKAKQKISATAGGFTGNLSGHNFFGSSMAILKDLDGDGIKDMVVGNIYDNTGNSRAGAIWILFLNANGTVKTQQKIANGTGGFPSILDADDNFGIDVTDLGDVNNDGNTDIAVGAHLDDDGGANRGAVYVLYLNSNGTVKSYKKISSTSGNFGGTLNDGDGFGYGISNVTDFNNDGIGDIAVGARIDDDGGTDRGAVWLLNLDANEDVSTYTKISSITTGLTGALDNSDQFGSGVEVIGDINNDNINDIAVSSPLDDDGGTNTGAVYLIHLTSTGGVKSYIKISKKTQAILNSQIDNSDYMGWKVSYLNDINNDGHIEILTGAMLDDDGGSDRGAAYIFNLGDTCRFDCLKTNLQSKISATQGGFSGTLANSDGFGGGLNGIGDIDKDGIIDMAVGSPADDDGSSNAGAVWILFMKKDGTVRTQQKISATQGNFTGNLSNGNYFGNRIVPLGDLNADGIPDIAVSHHFDNTGNARSGSVWILFLNSNGTVKSSQQITTSVGGFSASLQSDDRFGLGLECIGDFDGDGVVDLLAGAQEDKDAGTAKGAFYILYLNTNGTVKGYSKISATKGNFSGTLNSIDRFGFSLTAPGDINKDGVVDFIIGARDDANGGPYRGAIWTLFMNANGTVKSYQKNSSTIGNLTGIKDNDQFGQDMRTLDDLDGDGLSEIIVSAPTADDGGTDRGAAWIVYFSSDGKIKKQTKISSSSTYMNGKLDNSDYFGWGVGVLNDLNQDGFKEIAIGAYFDDDGGTDRGAVYIFNVADTCKEKIPTTCLKLVGTKKISSTNGGFSGSLANGDRFGYGSTAIGDLDKDGVTDMAVGAPYDNTGGSLRGAVWINFMNADNTIKSTVKISSSTTNFTGVLADGDLFGADVAAIGDLNNDGVRELLVGAIGDDNGGANTGAAYILFMKTDGSILKYKKIGSGLGGFSGSISADYGFGISVDKYSDFDGDGISDAIIGSYKDPDGGSRAGAVWIITLKTDGSVKANYKISSSTAGIGSSTLAANDYFGNDIAYIGDIDGDGIGDFSSTAIGDDDGGTDRGALYVLNINANGTVKKLRKISSISAGFNSALKDNDWFGYGLENVVSSSDKLIFLVTSAYDDDGGTDRGAAYVIETDLNASILKYYKYSSTHPKLTGQIDNGDIFGSSAFLLKSDEVKGDYTIGIGAQFDDDGGSDRGALYLLTLKDTCPISTKPKCAVRADFSYKLACLTDTFKFTDVSIDSLKAGIIKWKWSFGDGNSYEGSPKANHLYTTAGSYLVKLVVYTNGNVTCADSVTRPVKVNSQFRILGLPDDTICMSDSAELGVDRILCGTQPFSYLWQPSTGLSNDKLLFPRATPLGTTRYILTVTDKNNQKVYDTLIVKVDSSCCKSFAIFKTNGDYKCEQDTFIITNQSVAKSGATYNWKITAGGNYTSYIGISPPPLIFNTTGTYNVRLIITDVCGNDTMSHDLFVYPKAKVNAGRDTSLCLGDSLVIGPIAEGRNVYRWSPVNGLNSPIISQPTAYFTKNISYVLKMVTEEGCTAYDTINLFKVSEPKLNIGPDSILCSDTGFVLKSNIIAKSYLWNNATTKSFLKANNSGLYWLEAKDKCLQRDSAIITLLNKPIFTLGNDTVLCGATSFLLKANINTTALSKKWDNGATTDTRTVNKSGKYWLTLDNGKCNFTDSINLQFSKIPFAYLGPDTTICDKTSILVDATDTFATSYLWNDGNINPVRQLSTPGRYIVTLSNKCGSYKVTINIGVQKPAIPYLGEKLSMCIGDTITLNATNPNAKYYLWNDGTVKPIKSVSLPGIYSVMMGNICGDFDTSVLVIANRCDCDFYVPNTFTPVNSAGVNDLFKPVIPQGCEPAYYQLNIYNRWGEILFTTNDYNEGWNGTYKGEKMIFGNYTWIITIQHPYMNKGKKFHKTGSLLIID